MIEKIMNNNLGISFALAICLVISGIVPFTAYAEKNPKPEELVEKVILAYGGRPGLYGIQRNGTIRALVKFVTPNGTLEAKSVTKFIKKEKLKDDLLMIEIDMDSSKYILGTDGKEVWTNNNGVISAATFQESKSLHSPHMHSYEALLRYKENNYKLEYVGNKKITDKKIFDIITMTTPEGIKTTYEISRDTYRILYADYEEKPDENSEPVKYRINYKNFKVVQNAVLLPHETKIEQNGKIIEERTVIESTFNMQLEDKIFKVEIPK